MDFHLTKEQLLVRKMYREFAENEVKPLAAEIDEEERFPMETVEKMAKLGMMGIYFPKEYGGAGGDVLSYAMCVEELAKVCGTTAVIVSAHTSLCCAPIFEHGTEAQKQKYLPDLLSGKKIGAFGLTEPGAGTDAQGQQTTAVLDESGENYILNGSKCFITNGNVADTFVIIAVTGKTTDKRGRTMKEISAFIVEKDDPGFSQGKHEKKMGIRGSSTCDLIFEDCVIPKDRTCWARRARASRSPCRPWTAAVSVSPLRLWVWARAPWRRPSSTPRSASSSVSASPSSRTPSSSWPTCTPGCRLLSSWSTPLP